LVHSVAGATIKGGVHRALHEVVMTLREKLDAERARRVLKPEVREALT
jgi:hypothetical protein